MTKGLILSAPSSGSGKTTITLGLLRALQRVGITVQGAKSGPDYIDPRFHEAATGRTCFNLDAWAMTPERIKTLANGSSLLLIEGAMGLFDGAPPDGKGSTADLAQILSLPVVLIVDASRMAQSVVPLIAGFSSYHPKVHVVAVILNNVGSSRHEQTLRNSLEKSNIRVLGAIQRQPGLIHPSRHLGLVQAEERQDLHKFLEQVADTIAKSLNLKEFVELAADLAKPVPSPCLPPPAQRIAIAKDRAFAFSYPHILEGWKASGAELSFFSPLEDETPAPADLIYLPGGYPELHAEQLANAAKFRTSMSMAAKTTQIYGECGGYMSMGDVLTDASGKAHPMLGLLRLETSFEKRKLHLGYRHLVPHGGPFKSKLSAHEFHYASTLKAEGKPLFGARDAAGSDLGAIGLMDGNISGSFAHIIEATV